MRGSLIALPALLAACGGSDSRPILPGADVARGAELIREYGCGACHVIPGIAAARSLVGPPLNDYHRRAFIAGVLPNRADNLVRWIMMPQLFIPGGAMPDLGVSEAEAGHIAAYLYSPR